MHRQRKSETEPSMTERATSASAGHAKRPRAARVRAGATTPRTSKDTVVKPPDARQAPKITHEEIALLAYFYWEARQSPHGSAEDDWFRAERELRARTAPSM